MFEMKYRSAYFVSRHAEETAAADAATTQAARIAHLELAMRYSLLAAQPPAADQGTSEPLTIELPRR